MCSTLKISIAKPNTRRNWETQPPSAIIMYMYMYNVMYIHAYLHMYMYMCKDRDMYNYYIL